MSLDLVDLSEYLMSPDENEERHQIGNAHQNRRVYHVNRCFCGLESAESTVRFEKFIRWISGFSVEDYCRKVEWRDEDSEL